jgi:hypothetical protein
MQSQRNSSGASAMLWPLNIHFENALLIALSSYGTPFVNHSRKTDNFTTKNVISARHFYLPIKEI